MRPTKYQKKFCKIILEKMQKGDSVVSCCAELGIAKDTFYNWVKEHTEFSDAYRIGMALAEKYWEEIGKLGIFGLEVESAGKKGRVHPGMYSFFMKNRFKWTDRIEQVIDADVTSVSAADMTPEQRKQLIAAFMSKANEP